MLRRTELRRVVGEAVLRLCHADRKLIEAKLGERVYLLFRGGQNGYAVAAVDFSDDGVNLVLDAALKSVGEAEVALLFFAQAHDLARKLLAAFAALCPYIGQYGVYAKLAAFGDDELYLSVGIRRETVHRDDAGQTVHVFDV